MIERMRTLLICLFLLIGFSVTSTLAQVVPNPVLVFSGQTLFQTGGKQSVRYNYFVFNAESYPAELFVPSPDLPPCGANARSARTWIDVYDMRGKRLNGFCAIAGPDKLNTIWFALDPTELPPSWIYIEFNDRKTGTKYKSNLAETVL